LTYRARMVALGEDRRLDSVTVFKNVGAEAGASMAHLHSQVIATPFVPNDVRGELHGAEAAFKQHGRCSFCGVLRHAGWDNRVVAESGLFAAVCPFAPRFAYEFWV